MNEKDKVTKRGGTKMYKVNTNKHSLSIIGKNIGISRAYVEAKAATSPTRENVRALRDLERVEAAWMRMWKQLNAAMHAEQADAEHLAQRYSGHSLQRTAPIVTTAEGMAP